MVFVRRWIAGGSLALALLPLSGHAADSGAAPAAGADQAKNAGYAIGFNIGQSIRRDGLPLDLDSVIEGIRAAVGGQQPRIDAQAMQAALQQLQQDVVAKQEKAIADAAAAATSYLAGNAKRSGVTTTASGLQYEVLKQGTGSETPAATSQVTTHYEGKLIDGTVFDSSLTRGEPATFGVNQVIKGWQEALQLMHTGDKWRLHIPPDLGYGPQGQGPIPPNAVLVFDLELLEIKPQQ
jgi:FKBP-type peptidyl-prolyl cis-trans isomerase FklB